jgi:membrane protein YqaA with SNARE-associated domain
MESLVEALDAFVRGLSSLTAGLGLFVIAFFDSSLLSLPEINDVLLVYFGARFPDNAFYYATMTVLGSASGGSLLYGLARWKGYAMIARRFSGARSENVFGLVRRYGALAVLVPAILPPPFPFKIFLLAAGSLGLPYARFLAAIVVGRTIRYFGEAYVAVRYGEEAMSFLHANARNVVLAAVVLVSGFLVVRLAAWLRRRRRRNAEPRTPLEPRVAEEP